MWINRFGYMEKYTYLCYGALNFSVGGDRYACWSPLGPTLVRYYNTKIIKKKLTYKCFFVVLNLGVWDIMCIFVMV